MSLFSIKMRASQKERHISGAERILPETKLPAAVQHLTERALHHSLGKPDYIQVKVEEIEPASLQYYPALPVSSIMANTVEEGKKALITLLEKEGIVHGASLLTLLEKRAPMRGAILYDLATHTCQEPDKERGVRVTYMDSLAPRPEAEKCHFQEALILATKTAHAPGMIGEICISDDPDYVTGYYASLTQGYVRISPLKEHGASLGGRIFIFDSRLAEVETVCTYLEKQPVCITDMALPPKKDPLFYIEEELAQLKKDNLYRTTQVLSAPQTTHVYRNGKEMLLLSSNTYLDLANHPKVKEASANAVLSFGTSSGGSRLTTGTQPIHEELEQALAAFKHTEGALVFNTGYMTNLGTISALSDEDTLVFSDEYNHASIIDGCRLGKGKTVVYRHLDMKDLEKKLKEHPCKKGIIVSDAVFSMDGDILDLPMFVRLGKEYKMLTMVDEAHSTGVLGKTGHGITEHFHYTCQPDILMGTLSKALGSEGGFICSSLPILSYLKNKARSFIFATAPAPSTLAAALSSLHVLQEEPQRVQALQENIRFFCRALHNEGIEAHSETAIIPILIGDEKKAVAIAAQLQNEGLLIPPIRYPTVPLGTARLRVALMATHTQEELTYAAKAIGKAIQTY